jgi:hypothetical protein
MDVKKEITAIQKEVGGIDDPILIKAIKGMLVYRKKMEDTEWWDGLSEQEKQKYIHG